MKFYKNISLYPDESLDRGIFFEKNLKYYQKTPIFISDEYSKEGGI